MKFKKLLRGPLVWVLLFVVLLMLGWSMIGGTSNQQIDTSEGLELLQQQAADGDVVEQVEITEGTQRVQMSLTEDFESEDADGNTVDHGSEVEFFYVTPQGEEVANAVREADPPEGFNSVVPQQGFLSSMLLFLLPMMIIFIIFWFLLSRMQGGG
ncbi:cell division protein FtsH, partial [Georgenia sp. 10Sc9-8]|nr:cell division protein FtsH [Georgenia halotolerans]